MSAEKIVKRQLWRMVAWRLVGDVIAIPRRLLGGVVDALLAIEEAVFYLELDAARRYEQLTDVDMGAASGNENRYAGLRADAEAFDE